MRTALHAAGHPLRPLGDPIDSVVGLQVPNHRLYRVVPFDELDASGIEALGLSSMRDGQPGILGIHVTEEVHIREVFARRTSLANRCAMLASRSCHGMRDASTASGLRNSIIWPTRQREKSTVLLIARISPRLPGNKGIRDL